MDHDEPGKVNSSIPGPNYLTGKDFDIRYSNLTLEMARKRFKKNR